MYSRAVGVVSFMETLRKAVTDEARAVRAKILRASRQRRAYTLGEFWELTHLPSLATAREGTRKQQCYRWKLWIAPHFAKVPWKQITAPRIAEWLKEIQGTAMGGPLGGKGTTLSTGSVRNVFSTLSAILSHAVAIGHLASSPAAPARRYLPKYRPSEQAKKRERALMREHAIALIQSPRLAAWTRTELTFAIFCCTRRGETHGLQWKNVFPKGTRREPTPHVRIERSHSGPTKTATSTRDIPIHPELAPILEAHRIEWTRRFKREPTGEDFVFPAPNGAMRAKNSGSRMRKIVRTAGVPRITYHGLRHTGATLYRAAGVRREDIASLMGHTGTITDLYAPPLLPWLFGEVQKLRLINEIDAPPSGGTPGCGGGPTAGAECKPGSSVLDSMEATALGSSPMPIPPAEIAGTSQEEHVECINPDGPRSSSTHTRADSPTLAATTRAQGATGFGYSRDELAALFGEDDVTTPTPDTERATAPAVGGAMELLSNLWGGITG